VRYRSTAFKSEQPPGTSNVAEKWISDLAVAATQHDRQVLRSMNFEPIGTHLFACRSCSNWVITVPKQVHADAAAQCHTAQEIVHTLELPSLDPSSPSGFHSLVFCRKRREELTPDDTHSLWGLQQVSAKFVIWKSLSEIEASSAGIASIKENALSLRPKVLWSCSVFQNQQ